MTITAVTVPSGQTLTIQGPNRVTGAVRLIGAGLNGIRGPDPPAGWNQAMPP
ncbi:hypothetical protein SAMN05892883_3092 [Jatrophihabitans sp. GAS493]|uniref:hypothetical protein n=1 Tax=Jatrophihabitans sp. GAS493 TaxID=1907575 RepID=UPI000BC085F4|nr:hypothetical protein [Jatrophihabitans sp. GAS493]SOD73898.1 hypothetical protein SAMN05892883_3092 [Jatrophihabitans sp. GAS493]